MKQPMPRAERKPTSGWERIPEENFHRHWVVLPKRFDDRPRVITLEEAVEEWERLGYGVLGPFVLENAEKP